MKILAIETATEACSAAVLCEDDIVEQYEVAPRRHNELILPMCEQVLAECDVSLEQLDAVAFGCGPGAFTGVRIAAGVTQGIAYAHDLPVVMVSTLANLAQQAISESNQRNYILPAIDARMDEIYWAIYQRTDDDSVELVGQECVQAPDSIDINSEPISYGLGSGWKTYQTVLQNKTQLDNERVDTTALPHAKFTAMLGKERFKQKQIVNAAEALPVYLRDDVVHQK